MSSRLKLLVIADDLTGANDTGVQFARGGIASFVFTSHGRHIFPPDAEVVVINTESRHVDPSIAAQRVKEAAEWGLAQQVPYFYKKTDSTLRGNPGAELAAFLSATKTRMLPFVPAFPELGRTTRAGRHYVFGKPISQTAFAEDPLNPIRESDIRQILQQQTDVQVSATRLQEIRANMNLGIAVCDCETIEEMNALGRKLFGELGLRSGAGSAAFAQVMARHIPFVGGNKSFPAPRGPVLLVNGSVNERSLEQIRPAGALGFVQHRIVPEVVTNEKAREKFVQELVRTARERPQQMMLYSISSKEELEQFERLGSGSAEGLHLEMAAITGGIVRDLLKPGWFNSLVVFGGDTLNAIARACHWEGFVPETELSAGVTVAHPRGSDLKVISKAGGFGEPDLLEEIMPKLA